jgi:lipopolysaccharide transport system ATP-binding protein
MSDFAIKIEGLGKQYRIGAHANPRKTLREMLAEAAGAPFRRARSVLRGEAAGGKGESFWALRDVSFEVIRGEVIGIIGRNGAGKSTLLKVLSRITDPTCGEVRMRGRVGALLEVGTGFHGELTGRDNTYLNGAILGMHRAEIRRKFDDIVAFAEVEKFIDTPVKHYSSGMYMRLAFAVAAHLEPEILIVDEVLAVGDVAFQKKCLGKIGEVAQGGRTVLLVSHNLAVIRQLCERCIWLDQGQAVAAGPTGEVVDGFVDRMLSGRGGITEFLEDPNKHFQLVACRTVNAAGVACTTFDCDEPVRVELTCRSRRPIPGLYAYMALFKHPEGVIILESDTFDKPPNVFDRLSPGLHRITFEIPPRTIGIGRYLVNLSFASPQSAGEFHVDTPEYTVEFNMLDHGSRRGNNRNGYLSTLLRWSVSTSSPQAAVHAIL